MCFLSLTSAVWWSAVAGAWSSLHIRTEAKGFWSSSWKIEKIWSWCCQGNSAIASTESLVLFITLVFVCVCVCVCSGTTRRSDNIPWTRPTRVLSCAKSQLIEGMSKLHDSRDVHMTVTWYTLFPILSLIQIGVREYVRCLEQSVISTLSHFNRHGYTTDDTGVWVTDCDGNPNKICAIGMSNILCPKWQIQYLIVHVIIVLFCAGIQVSHGVSYHGLALNCSTDLSWFDHIVPCGLEDKAVTSLSHTCQRRIEPSQVEDVLVKSLADIVGLRTLYHPLWNLQV